MLQYTPACLATYQSTHVQNQANSHTPVATQQRSRARHRPPTWSFARSPTSSSG